MHVFHDFIRHPIRFRGLVVLELSECCHDAQVGQPPQRYRLGSLCSSAHHFLPRWVLDSPPPPRRDFLGHARAKGSFIDETCAGSRAVE